MYRHLLQVITLTLLLSFVTFTNSISAESQLSINQKCPSGTEINLTFDTNKLHVMQPVNLELKIIDKKGKQISGAAVYCSLYMPNYATGSNNPKLGQDIEAGGYKGIVFFSQKGKWIADLTINYEDGGYEEVSIEIGEVLPSES